MACIVWILFLKGEVHPREVLLVLEFGEKLERILYVICTVDSVGKIVKERHYVTPLATVEDEVFDTRGILEARAGGDPLPPPPRTKSSVDVFCLYLYWCTH